MTTDFYITVATAVVVLIILARIAFNAIKLSDPRVARQTPPPVPEGHVRIVKVSPKPPPVTQVPIGISDPQPHFIYMGQTCRQINIGEAIPATERADIGEQLYEGRAVILGGRFIAIENFRPVKKGGLARRWPSPTTELTPPRTVPLASRLRLFNWLVADICG